MCEEQQIKEYRLRGVIKIVKKAIMCLHCRTAQLKRVEPSTRQSVLIESLSVILSPGSIPIYICGQILCCEACQNETI